MGAFLLSETYSTPKTINLAAVAKFNGSLMVSDNGNFSRMKKIAATFVEKGQAIAAKAQQDVLTKGHVTKKILREHQNLFAEIRDAVNTEQQNIAVSDITERQLKCRPDYMIGMEDLTIPILHMCNIFHPVFSPDPKLIRPFQKNTQKIYIEQQKGTFGFQSELSGVLKFLVYHAYDYKSARQAYLINKNTDAEGVAVSFGATLTSQKYIQSIEIGRKTYNFSEPLPEAYLLSVALILGACGNDVRNLPVHILGAGTPILIILLALLLKKSKAISIDSTATFKDADDGNIYGSRNAYMKMDMYKVAAYCLVDDEPYQSSSPWFAWFNAQYPSDWKGLQAKLAVKPEDDINELKKILKNSPQLLEKYMPFFSPMRGGNDMFIRKVRIARAGTNFWALENICKEVRKRKKNFAALNKWIESEVARYEKFAAPKWAITVRACFEIIKKQQT